ncbi:hypothetical protein [Amycolatopsis taiwanensis]|uniref:hypothetical protein n=1 Tax=Amycolatopsis taiwanensis TaxID=342230 RepID=UPI000480C68F|nr:hypothetical protein [Amycolatopsis taiwanensis]
MQPAPPTTFFLERSSRVHRRQLRRLRIFIATQCCNVAWPLAGSITLAVLGSGASGWILSAAAVPALGLAVQQLRVYSVHKAMRNLRLIFSPQGVGYESDVGAFHAPWSAVRRMRINSWAGRHYLSVRVPYWSGPIGAFGMFGELVLPLKDIGVAHEEIRNAVNYLSNGTVVVR